MYRVRPVRRYTITKEPKVMNLVRQSRAHPSRMGVRVQTSGLNAALHAAGRAKPDGRRKESGSNMLMPH